MHAVILSIGDELTSGLTTNTNASWLAQQLGAIGISTRAHVTVSDSQPAIAAAIREAGAAAELLLISGGLGPTEDDVTRQALAEALGSPLVEDAGALAEITAWFAARQRPMSDSNRIQAQRPAAARCLTNTAGTAPGLAATLANAAGGCRIFVAPGVPREMREMFARSILPELAASSAKVTLPRKLNTFGQGESIVGEKIKDLMTRAGLEVAGARVQVGTTVYDGIVSVRIYATGSRPVAEAAAEEIAGTVRSRLGSIVFSENEDPLELAVGKLLTAEGMTVATAESCTGGMVAQLLTNLAGSSAYFSRGWVTYANGAKVEELGVPAEMIGKHGAVSEEVALAMAEHARAQARADFALATTGIAGPSGGSAEKPVGTVWIALATPEGTVARKWVFPGDRSAVRLRAAQMGLAMLRWTLLGVEEI